MYLTHTNNKTCTWHINKKHVCTLHTQMKRRVPDTQIKWHVPGAHTKRHVPDIQIRNVYVHDICKKKCTKYIHKQKKQVPDTQLRNMYVLYTKIKNVYLTHKKNLWD